MDRVDILLTRQINYVVNTQISINRPLALTNKVGLIGFISVQRKLVFFRVYCHRTDAKLCTGAEDSDGNLPAVGGHNFTKFFDGHINHSPQKFSRCNLCKLKNYSHIKYLV